MEKKQSSIEWLENKIDNRDMGEIPMWVYEFIDQAKAMHKEEMKVLANDFYFGCCSYKNFEKYYNETFGGEQ
tara:strand:+ start:2031 stop:2246 length:216 start_codon:yes stop_codon:yes gene_type:complete